jgi:hypothetical protein
MRVKVRRLGDASHPDAVDIDILALQKHIQPYEIQCNNRSFINKGSSD